MVFRVTGSAADVRGDDLLALGAARNSRAAFSETVAEVARGEAVGVQRRGAGRVDAVAAMSFGKAAHALHGGVGLLGKVPRAALGPGQRIDPDPPRPAKQDVTVLRMSRTALRRSGM